MKRGLNGRKSNVENFCLEYNAGDFSIVSQHFFCTPMALLQVQINDHRTCAGKRNFELALGSSDFFDLDRLPGTSLGNRWRQGECN